MAWHGYARTDLRSLSPLHCAAATTRPKTRTHVRLETRSERATDLIHGLTPPRPFSQLIDQRRTGLLLPHSRSANHRLRARSLKPLEAPLLHDTALQLHHPLLIARRIRAVSLEPPAQEPIRVVGLERLVQHTEALTVAGDLVPVAADVLQVGGEVREAALEDLAVGGRVERALEVDQLRPGAIGFGEHKVGGALDGAQEGADFVRVRGEEAVVGDVQDAAEAAAPQLRQLVDAQHLHVFARPALGREPLLQLDHLHVLEADAGVDGARGDALGHVHAHAHRRVVGRGHAVVRGQLVELDLAELAYVADALAPERVEVWADARGLEVHDAREGLVEQRAKRRHWEAAGGGRQRVDHGFEAQVDFA
ncbi:hypothetical protein B5807_04240 [Epicoccum nigrum]|uniref:Uncharacterized protein n=1 Tax=Epicoccum nigrum TaxID=105696 RepID=A0A1Y2M7G5_EPING|nr:hypothetical protein B5807_04240 [Epicoccum nigrum]